MNLRMRRRPGVARLRSGADPFVVAARLPGGLLHLYSVMGVPPGDLDTGDTAMVDVAGDGPPSPPLQMVTTEVGNFQVSPTAGPGGSPVLQGALVTNERGNDNYCAMTVASGKGPAFSGWLICQLNNWATTVGKTALTMYEGTLADGINQLPREWGLSARKVGGVPMFRGVRNQAEPFPALPIVDEDAWLFVAWSWDDTPNILTLKISALGGTWGDQGTAMNIGTQIDFYDGLNIGWNSNGSGLTPDDLRIAAVGSYGTAHPVDTFSSVFAAAG